MSDCPVRGDHMSRVTQEQCGACTPALMGWQVDTPIHEAVMQALGAASVCWSNPAGAGEFDSVRASAIGEELIRLLQAKLWVDA